MQQIVAIILAAGKGTRMKSRKHKLLHEICGRPLIEYVLKLLESLGIARVLCIVGHEAQQIKEYLGDRVEYVEQREQLGTGHAVLQAKPLLREHTGLTLIVNGDHPLFRPSTIEGLIKTHKLTNAALTILTTHLADPTGYGRIIRAEDGSIERTVEEKDGLPEELAIKEVSTGLYLFDTPKLWSSLAEVGNENAQNEYYLPDAISILSSHNERIMAEVLLDPDEAEGVNDRVHLAAVNKKMRRRILEEHMRNGVTIVDPDNTYIEADVQIEADTTLEPGCILRKQTKIGANSKIGPQVQCVNVQIGSECMVLHAVISDSIIDNGVNVGPYVYIRPGSHIYDDVRVGCFVELKKSSIGQRSKVSHLSYVGDTEVGRDVNIACGVVTVNYDGRTKHRTMIEDGAFIGCNVNLIAPLRIGENAYIAAGSTVTKDVNKDSLVIARKRQKSKEGYAKRFRNKEENE